MENLKVKISLGSFVLPVLLVSFILMKAAGIITWSWFWVWSPVWIPIAIFLGLGIVGVVLFGVVTLGLFLFGLIVEIIKSKK